jgi:FtsH-binding integral membrane protein
MPSPDSGSSARSRSSTSTGCAERAPTAPSRIAASIFLDTFNVFLLLLQLFGGKRD